MMAQLSPPVQRAAAIGLLLLAVLLAIEIASATIGGAMAARDRLLDARERSARLEAIQTAPADPARARPAPLPPGLAFSAPDRAAAAEIAATAISGAAAAQQLPAPSLAHEAPNAANPNLIGINVRAEGDEQQMLRFIAAVESGTPALRLRTWRLVRVQEEPSRLQLDALVLGAWAGPQ
jgi:hypothetical protein